MRAGCHWLRGRLSSFRSTTSLIWMLGRTWFHFWHSYNHWRKSFFHRFQNSFANCWTQRHLLWEYRSAHLKSPGDGKRGFDFIVSRWLGMNGSCEDSVINPSIVSGLLLTIASASHMRVRSNSSSNCWPELCKSAHKTARTERICLSQTPPLWLTEGGFILNLVKKEVMNSGFIHFSYCLF